MTTRLAHSPLAPSAVETFETALRGPLVRPGDAEYDGLRKVWNGMIDKRPALIARCSSADDVVTAVRFARDHELRIAVRGGGHNVAGYATCDGGLVIDLSLMKGVQVDPERRLARAEGGVTWGELDRETQVYGLATPGGEVSVTGIAGLTLSGGMGYLRRKHGLSCDNLVALELVTAEGERVTASAAEHPELFWALRGGGGNFGVVTAFTYQLHPVGPDVATLSVAYPLERARELLRSWHAFTKRAPDEVSSSAIAWSVPATPDVPAELHGRPILILDGMYAGDVATGEALFAPLRELATPLYDASARAAYTALQSAMDSFMPDGDRYYWKSLFIDALDEAFGEAFIAWAGRRPSPRSLVVIRHLGGAVSRVGETETAFGNRSVRFNLSIDATWNDPADDEANIAWARGFWDDMRRFSNGGVYLNFAGSAEEAASTARAGHGANYERLVAVKNTYDPGNVFRVNQNIEPTRVKG